MTISPSSTNFFAANLKRAAITSGKYRVKGFPDFDSNEILLPSRNARHRKPSHLGSYCQLSPVGNSEAGRASMGRYFFLMGNAMQYLSCYRDADFMRRARQPHPDAQANRQDLDKRDMRLRAPVHSLRIHPKAAQPRAHARVARQAGPKHCR